MKYDRRYKEDIIKLRELGMSYNEIQKELGCSKGTIAYHVGKGQKKKYHYRSSKHRDELTLELGKIKEGSGCVDCGNKNLIHKQLDFDHVRGIKVDGISAMIRSYSREAIFEEIKKCDIVCANCHRMRTHLRSLKK